MLGDGFEQTTILRAGPRRPEAGSPRREFWSRPEFHRELWWRLTATAGGKRAGVSTGTRLAEESFQSHPMSTNPTR